MSTVEERGVWRGVAFGVGGVESGSVGCGHSEVVRDE